MIKDPPQKLAVGIDLGTTTTTVAVMRPNGELVAVPIEDGQTLIPSVLAVEDEIFYGQRAIERGVDQVDGIVESFKRDMGEPHYHRKIRDQWVPPEVLNAFLLEAVCKRAQQAIGDFKDVVITVPAYFDERRRKATFEAGRLAGLNVIDIVNEPIAAAISDLHYLGANQNDESAAGSQSRIMVYDLGGGTFDVSILQIDGKEIRTLATDGDVQLGGRDFDERLADEIATQFLDRFGVDPRADLASIQRLWILAQKAKHELTESQSTTVACNFQNMRMGIEITRRRFEELIDMYIERTLLTCCDALEQAGLKWIDIDRVVLVGGSSRIPLVTDRLTQFYGKRPNFSHSPDQAVALGAAYFAATAKSDSTECLRVVNVNAHSLSVAGFDLETNEPIARVLIPRNSRLPASKQCTFVTRKENQKTVEIKIVEGESENPKFCSPVGKCVVHLSPNLPQRTTVLVNCVYDTNGTISVSAKIPLTHQSGHVEICRDGQTDLESLAVWRERLIRGITAPSQTTSVLLPELPLVSESTSGDRGAQLQRADYLCQEIGKLSADVVVPVNAVMAQRQLQSAKREFLAVDYLLSRVKEKSHLEPDATTRGRLHSAAAMLKMYRDQSSRYLMHARVMLGRECFAAGKVPDALSKHTAELNQLMQTLN